MLDIEILHRDPGPEYVKEHEAYFRQSKRFKLSKEGFAQERVRGIQEIIADLKTKYPEVLSFCVFGSTIKGDAKIESDIDGYLFVDAEKLAKDNHVSQPDIVDDVRLFDQEGEVAHDFNLCQALNHRYLSEIRESFRNKLGLSERQVKDVKILPVSNEIIDAAIISLQGWAMAQQTYESQTPAKSVSSGIDILQRPPIEPVSHNLYTMFHLAIGNSIRPYRAYLINKLSNISKTGERIWRHIIRSTEGFEQGYGWGTEKRYPRTLDRATEVYGH